MWNNQQKYLSATTML